jgi:2,4-dienoyl-CoA reductase-like NADH-dependent reductase (Old Yellow Enzyme family)
MTTAPTDNDMKELEKAIRDAIAKSGAGAVIFILDTTVQEMYETADHLDASWGDHTSAKAWTRCAGAIDKVSAAIGKSLE